MGINFTNFTNNELPDNFCKTGKIRENVYKYESLKSSKELKATAVMTAHASHICTHAH